MDAVYFGRWISERRRKYGWSSQRALAETARHNPLLAEWKISEDFLARLEAGRLSHPFRGNVRKQVLALAWLLCKTSRDVQTYLNAAELTELSAEESELLGRLRDSLTIRRTPAVSLLCPRPARLFGRTLLLHEMISTLCTMETGCCAITGMAGVGKSTLAYEAVHALAPNDCLLAFPDGIATFSCTKRRGERGLIALLNEMSVVFSQQQTSTRSKCRSAARSAKTKRRDDAETLTDQRVQASLLSPVETWIACSQDADSELADAIDRTRMALMDKSVLILLDDVDPQFPIRQALDALLGHAHGTSLGRGDSVARPRRVVLTTSRAVLPTALVSYHVHLDVLEAGAALELLASLIGASPSLLEAEDRSQMEQICAALGYLPLAIEAAANALVVKGIPLALLAAQVRENPLASVLDGDGFLRATLEQALRGCDVELQEQFALLATLGVQTFGLECAAALRTRKPERRAMQLETFPLSTLWHATAPIAGGGKSYHGSLTTWYASDDLLEPCEEQDQGFDGTVGGLVDVPLTLLANTAADLGVLVSRSLLELETVAAADYPRNQGTRYRLHPLFAAYAQARLEELEPERVHAARRNVQSYAEAYLECFQGDVEKMERERAFLLAVLEQAWLQEQYPQVVRFVARLLHVVGRMSRDEDGERFLLWGIYASRQVQDRYHLARFLGRLGWSLCARGELEHAQHIWQESLAIADELGYPAHLWQPLISLAHLAHLRGDVTAARQYVKVYLHHAQDDGDMRSIAKALLNQGFYARLEGDRDAAYDDVSEALSLLSKVGLHLSDTERMLEQKGQVEMARLQGDYACAQEVTELVVTIAQQNGDLYAVADVLWDQAEYAYQQRQLEDTRLLARRVLDIAERIGASHFHTRAVVLLRQVADEYMPQKM